MKIRYTEAQDIKQLVERIVAELDFNHINLSGIHCFRSFGSRSKRTVARVHALGKLWQKALHTHPSYVIEVISERYDNLSQTEREKILIHELLHIPKSFAGGFRPHKGYITRRKIDDLYEKFGRKKIVEQCEVKDSAWISV